MRPEDIDDLFRNSLDDHASPPPPADALWARLQQAASEPAPTPAPPADERLDALFQGKLSAHITPPGRELWERLEDEHLRPRQRRVAAWWPMAIAAVVALLLVAGGAGLLTNGSFQTGGPGQLAVSTQPAASTAQGSVAAGAPAQAGTANDAEYMRNQAVIKNKASQATDLAAASSSAPEASEAPAATAAQTRPATRPAQLERQAVRSANAPMLAQQRPRRTETATPAGPEQPGREPAQQVAVDTTPSDNTPGLASAAGVIEVEVRKGNPTAAMPEGPVAGDEPDETQRRRGLGKLIGRASEAVRDAKQGLLARAAQYENVTVQARVGERTISKTIQL